MLILKREKIVDLYHGDQYGRRRRDDDAARLNAGAEPVP
jgi:hypothetical protein